MHACGMFQNVGIFLDERLGMWNWDVVSQGSLQEGKGTAGMEG